ncbi:MAG: phosphoglucosamine mutase [Patescibacteria group bacterium]|nr:phosphoglucosamine mutase [Patescibacteria group bacterium]
MDKPIFKVSGYRGVWKETLTEEIVINLIRAFIKYTNKEKPTILVGRDGRESGPRIKKIIIKELKQLGVTVIDGGILPTPTVLFSVKKFKYDGGIIITASHNPIEYNGIKLVGDDGLFISEQNCKKINEYYGQEIKHCRGKTKLITPNFPKEHVKQIINSIDVGIIKKRKFKVAVDMINASASVIDPILFRKLGVKLIPLNDTPNGKFNHKPEPLKENLQDVANLVKEKKADLGFAHDPDADRLVIINEKGEVISEEYTLVLSLETILSKNPNSTVVLNLSTSQMGADVAEKYNCKCLRSKIGEPNVVNKMIENNAIIGGEGNGGVIYPKINLARDSFVGLSLILEFLAKENKTITEAISALPKYYIKKDKWPVKDLNQIYSKIKENYKEAKFDEQDGLRVDFADKSWVHLRPSNTEPIIRLFGEAKTQERIASLFEEVKQFII